MAVLGAIVVAGAMVAETMQQELNENGIKYCTALKTNSCQDAKFTVGQRKKVTVRWDNGRR